MNSKELQEERGKLYKRINEIVLRAKNESGRPLNSEERVEFDRLDAEYKAKTEEIEGIVRMERWDREQLAEIETEKKSGSLAPMMRSGARDTIDINKAFKGWLARNQKGKGDVCSKDADLMGWEPNARIVSPITRSLNRRDSISRALDTTVNSGAGDAGLLMQTTLADAIYEVALYTGGVFDDAFKFETDTGAPFQLDIDDDTAGMGYLLAQNAQDTTDVDQTFTSITFGNHCVASGAQRISKEADRDSKYPLLQFVAKKLGERTGRYLNQLATIGSGGIGSSGAPQGILSTGGISLGATSASPTAIALNDLYSTFYAVPKAYRDKPGASWLVSDSLRAQLMGVLDGFSRPLWQMGDIRAGQQDTLLGQPVRTDANLQTFAATHIVAAFGSWEDVLHVRMVGGVEVDILRELYARYRQISIESYMWIDMAVVNASAGRYLKMHA
ncbi:MAG TPA: phage major capsid protein [Pyrinomonadaceae bacterium]